MPFAIISPCMLSLSPLLRCRAADCFRQRYAAAGLFRCFSFFASPLFSLPSQLRCADFFRFRGVIIAVTIIYFDAMLISPPPLSCHTLLRLLMMHADAAMLP